MCTAEIALPAVPSGHIIVPSLATADCADYHSVLIHDDARCITAGVGRPVEQHGIVRGPSSTTPKIDYFQTNAALPPTRLRLVANTSTKPSDYLAVVSIRPAHIDLGAPQVANTGVLDVPAKTQMVATEDVRMKICSPTCLSMTLDYLGVAHDFNEVVIAAYHRPTNLFGVWPQNVWASSRWGVLAAVETATSWDVVSDIIDAGHPLAASIAFEPGQLGGSPLRATDGHLVIVRGIQNNQVVVNDPAAKDEIDVPRRYDIDEFQDAWLATRGVFTVFAANAPATGRR